ncbi:Adenylyltransferase and sulfurtransferase MOCS3, partial [Camellia lanceoleosa]
MREETEKLCCQTSSELVGVDSGTVDSHWFSLSFSAARWEGRRKKEDPRSEIVFYNYDDDSDVEDDSDGMHEFTDKEFQEYDRQLTQSDGFDVMYFPRSFAFGTTMLVFNLDEIANKLKTFLELALKQFNEKEPLVSGAAIGLEGQLTVYNYNGGPCYWCLFPTPPPYGMSKIPYFLANSPGLQVMYFFYLFALLLYNFTVHGIIGYHQTLKAIKIASDVGEPLSRRMLLFDALTAQIRIVKIRERSSQCEVCGENATFTEKQFQEFDYEKFTQSPLSM